MRTITVSALLLAVVCAVSAQGFGGGFGGDAGFGGSFGFGAGEGAGFGGSFDGSHGHIPYKYEYGVKDPHTGDHKTAYEHGDGHGVKGGYTLEESDGTHRVVEYHGTGHGTNTIVKRVGHAKHPHHGVSYANQNLHI